MRKCEGWKSGDTCVLPVTYHAFYHAGPHIGLHANIYLTFQEITCDEYQ